MAPRMLACLAITALTGVVSCADSPLAPREPVALTVAPATDSVLLTYICGNMFRVRNQSFEPREVRWDIYNATPTDTGSLRLRGRDVGAPHVDYLVTARTKGTMRLFVGGVLRQTKANGNKAACAAPVDSSAFSQAAITLAIRTTVQTTAPIVESPDTIAYRRTLVNLQFRQGITNAERRAFQSRFNAQLVGVYGTVYQFRLSDLGALYAPFRARIDSIASDLAILRARPVSAFDRAVTFGARYPDDGPQFRRSNYLSSDTTVWAATAMRLPQAWACETGRYGGAVPRIAVLEQNFPMNAASDVTKSLLVPVIRDTSWRRSPIAAADSASFVNHGHAVAALVSASGDDSTGLAGPLWRSDLRVITPGNVNEKKGAGASFFFEVLSFEILRAAPRILSLSSDYRVNPDTLQREADLFAITPRLRQLLDSLPRLLVVQAVGNDAYQGSYAARDTALRTILQDALVSLRNESPAYRDRIVFVGETDRNGNRPTESNEFSGLVDIYAPGFGVPLLLPDGTTDTGKGTSFAAPAVAGIAGQLLAMDSTLSAADLKALLLAGARDSIENASGQNSPPGRVGNTFDVVYEADAYGSLRLLSARRGTPLCGATIMPWANAWTDGSFTEPGTLAVRYGGDTAVFNGTTLSASGLAPGGRNISYAPAHYQRFSSGTWSAPTTHTDGFRRTFGERDTLAYRLLPGPSDTPDNGPSQLRLRLLPGSRQWTLPMTRGHLAYGSISGLPGLPTVAPAGDKVVVPVSVQNGTGLDISHALIVLSQTAADTIPLPFSDLYTAPSFAQPGWSPTGARFAYFAWGFTLIDSTTSGPIVSRLVLVDFAGSNPQAHVAFTEPERTAIAVSWSAEGGQLLVIDAEPYYTGYAGCRLRKFHVTGASTLTLLRTDALPARVCSEANINDTPDWDAYLLLAGFGSGGGGGGGDGDGGGSGSGGMSGNVRARARRSIGATPQALGRTRCFIRGGTRLQCARAAAWPGEHPLPAF